MKNKIVFGKWESVSIMANLICAQLFLGFPRLMAELAGPASWILVIYFSTLALVAFLILARLYRNFEGKDLLDLGDFVAGGIGRIIVGIIILAYLLFAISLTLREFAEDLKVISLKLSPISFVVAFFLAGMLLGAAFGIEAIARFSAIAVPVIGFGYLFLLVAVSQFFDTSNLFPILGTGLKPIFIGGVSRVSTFSALTVLFLLGPFFRTTGNFKKIGVISILFSSIMMVLSVLSYTLVFPYSTSTESFLPVYQMARLINYGRFFQRVESIFLFIWVTAALLYLSIIFFLVLYIFRKTFKLEYHKPLMYVFGLLAFSLALLPQNLIQVVRIENEYFRRYFWLVAFALPGILLIWGTIRKKRKGGLKSNV